ncbi:hypothetical protein [Nisaea sediminum]|uniref:hypothetical protein n=1 Tax=Nisaea sediminum TaxID=2775867 RepID=UPI0018691B04|nr:hypothetical protein [Nisaea sediminum]
MRYSAKKMITSVALLLGLSACETPVEVNAALDTGIKEVTSIKSELGTFVTSRNAMRDDSEDTLRSLEGTAQTLRENEVRLRRNWALTGGDRDTGLKTMDIHKQGDDRLRDDPFGQKPAATGLGEPGKTFAKLKVDAAPYDEILKQYLKVREGRSGRETLKFFGKFAKDVADDVKALQEAKSEVSPAPVAPKSTSEK